MTWQITAADLVIFLFWFRLSVGAADLCAGVYLCKRVGQRLYDPCKSDKWNMVPYRWTLHWWYIYNDDGPVFYKYSASSQAVTWWSELTAWGHKLWVLASHPKLETCTTKLYKYNNKISWIWQCVPSLMRKSVQACRQDAMWQVSASRAEMTWSHMLWFEQVLHPFLPLHLCCSLVLKWDSYWVSVH